MGPGKQTRVGIKFMRTYYYINVNFGHVESIATFLKKNTESRKNVAYLIKTESINTKNRCFLLFLINHKYIYHFYLQTTKNLYLKLPSSICVMTSSFCNLAKTNNISFM